MRRKARVSSLLNRRDTNPYGEIFTETSFASAADFPIAGTGISRGTNKISLTGTPTLFSSYIKFDRAGHSFRYTCLEHWSQLFRYKTPTSFGGTSYGCGFGVISANTFDPHSTVIRWNMDTSSSSANLGKVYLYHLNSISGQQISSTRLVPTVNTQYWIQLTRAKNVITTSIYADVAGVIGSLLFTVSQTMSITSGYTCPHNTGQFVIHQFGGTTSEVSSWTTSTTARKGQDYLFDSDSNWHGLHAGSNSLRAPEIAAAVNNKTFIVHAGISDRSAEMLLRVPEIIALRPIHVIASFGRNDVEAGVSSGTRNANIDSYISQLQAAGIIVKTAGVIASNVNVSTVQDKWTSTGLPQVNSYTLTKNAGNSTLNNTYDSGDDIHLNVAGHALVGASLGTITT